MNRLVNNFWIFTSCFFCFFKTVTAQTQIKAGAAKINITPSYGTLINGGFLPMYTRVIHDSLYAKALAFNNGKKQFVFVVVDCMAIDAALINDTKDIIFKKLKLKPEQVMISATHAHSCGAVVGAAACPADLNYRLAMPEKICESVGKAIKNLRKAKITWGDIDVPKHPSCRRWYMKPGFPTINPFKATDSVWTNPPVGSEFLDRPVSPVDPEVSYIAVKGMDDKWISILSNYSIHFAADVPSNTISADYFGEVHTQLKKKLVADSNFVGITSNGTSGDVNVYDFRMEKNYPTAPYGISKMIANDVSDSIIHRLKTADWQTHPVFQFAYAKVKVSGRKPSAEQLSKLKQIVSQTDYRMLNCFDTVSDATSLLYAWEIVELAQYQKEYYSMPIQAIRIGEGTIGTLPGEFFAETGLKLKKHSDSKFYFTISLANFGSNYMPPRAQFSLGGYETWLCTGSSMEIDAEEKIYLSLLNLIRSMN